jgi:hypothetical protein
MRAKDGVLSALGFVLGLAVILGLASGLKPAVANERDGVELVLARIDALEANIGTRLESVESRVVALEVQTRLQVGRTAAFLDAVDEMPMGKSGAAGSTSNVIERESVLCVTQYELGASLSGSWTIVGTEWDVKGLVKPNFFGLGGGGELEAKGGLELPLEVAYGRGLTFEDCYTLQTDKVTSSAATAAVRAGNARPAEDRLLDAALRLGSRVGDTQGGFEAFLAMMEDRVDNGFDLPTIQELKEPRAFVAGLMPVVDALPAPGKLKEQLANIGNAVPSFADLRGQVCGGPMTEMDQYGINLLQFCGQVAAAEQFKASLDNTIVKVRNMKETVDTMRDQVEDIRGWLKQMFDEQTWRRRDDSQ